MFLAPSFGERVPPLVFFFYLVSIFITTQGGGEGKGGEGNGTPPLFKPQ